LDRGEDERRERQEPERAAVTEQRPILPAKEDLDRWADMPPRERCHDPSFQRYAQSFRSRESLSAAGKQGYSVTIGRYGKEYIHDRMADKRREREGPKSRAERRMVRMLEELGQREDRSEYGGTGDTYLREHKLAPSRHADFAWPQQHKAIEVWGGVHTRQFFVSQERVREANQHQIERAKAAGWELMIVTDAELARDRWDETRERVQRFLA
jgi:G:T-mismatch repair DNA endonuclease (very short patch repair protein)